ncbi:hypothetical protein CL633_04595 [bacterium]|jgi:hypothetical protein|nr:hypothetical protein [bacterium]|tara:strand:- start:13896 stop:14078 length:183 start_codon:yes stop_codon:yes gene_type:complete
MNFIFLLLILWLLFDLYKESSLYKEKSYKTYSKFHPYGPKIIDAVLKANLESAKIIGSQT